MAQDVAEGVPQEVAQDLAFGGMGGAHPPRHATTTAVLFLHSWQYTSMGAQLGSSVAFGSCCGQALPATGGAAQSRKAPLCLHIGPPPLLLSLSHHEQNSF